DVNTSKEFNIDIDNLVSHLVYTIKGNKLNADTKVMITTPYAKDISATNTFVMDDGLSYKGLIHIKELIGIDANLTKPLNNLNIEYAGDLQSVTIDILSDGLKGSFNSTDLKKAALHIETTKTIVLRDMIALPAELNNTRVDAIVDVPMDLTEIIPIKGNVKILSNVSNIDAEFMYDKSLKARAISNIPEDSLLKAFDENVKWNALNPLIADVELDKNNVSLKLKAKVLSSDVTYALDNGNVNGTLQLAGLTSTIQGNAQKKIMIKSNVSSIKSLFDNVREVYTLEGLPPVEGALDLSVDINELKEVDLLLSSPAIIYHSIGKTDQIINDVKLILSADRSKVQLKSYALTYDETKLFATKPSIVNMDEENIEISELWLNDELKVSGTYNTKTKEGNIVADATVLHMAHKIIDLDSVINIKTVLNGEKTSVNGKITLLGGNIHYDLSTKTYPSDSDILIVQEMKEKEVSPFMDNLSALIEVKTKKPLIYKQGPIDIQAIVDLGIHKAEHSELMVLGEVHIVKGGSYTFEGKKFVLDKSNIYFTGNPNKPLLDMSVKYKSLNYLITIGISGTPATPHITFSSIPSLQREQILSIILFDSEEGAGTNSGEDMMKMMGGAMAKSALTDIGIKLDHLAFGSDGSVEVGKKITDKITFIYINGEIPQVRVKYQHSPRLESVISADEVSTAYDIVYKRDLSEDDITIFGK
ncbi:MAG: translocation/assembly module TamB, partial [Sulfurovum sp.]|nr:translocation/assembly module TamB [Sulfurovum sp.]